ncbi:MAG: hypothetical protein ACREPY_17860, partial [Rhodanobacteraceae bacterium]
LGLGARIDPTGCFGCRLSGMPHSRSESGSSLQYACANSETSLRHRHGTSRFHQTSQEWIE